MTNHDFAPIKYIESNNQLDQMVEWSLNIKISSLGKTKRNINPGQSAQGAQADLGKYL